ncbi:bestrophin family protein [Nannocystaceae bacterium ST9]
MLILDRRTWLEQVLFLRASSQSGIWKRVAVSALLATIVTVLQLGWDVFEANLTPLPFTLVGLALSIFLGFRNTTGYDRFWEGRKLWGQLVNGSRSFSRQIFTLIAPPPGAADMPSWTDDRRSAIRRELVHALIGYVHAFRLHLRDEDPMPELARWLAPEQVEWLRGQHNRPISLLQHVGARLRELYDEGLIHAQHLPVLEASLIALTDIQGGCERIKATPIPASYTVLMHRIVLLYCVGLPFGIVSTVGLFTPIVALIVAYAFYGLDAVGTEIEDPFGRDPNDLPLDALSRMIEVELRQRLGDTDLPPLLEPIDGVLA